jgi:DHA2 family multidrug resistance protein
MDPTLPVFRAWAPEWLIRATLFAAALPTFMLMALYAANGPEVASYYGVEPADVQFSVLAYYVGLVAFFPFDQRLSGVLPTRQYFLVSTTLLVVVVGLTTQVHEWWLFISLRFVQGIIGSVLSTPCLMLIFSRLETTRARAMGYSVFYGALLASGPLTSMLGWLVLERYDVPALFHAFLLVQLPSAVLLLAILHNVRLKRRTPLSQLDWQSWVLLATTLSSLSYLAAYGQQLYWLESPTGWLALGLALSMGLAFGLRQRGLRRPYINLAVFKYRNFRLGLGLFVLFYLFRGTSGIAQSYYVGVLHVDAAEIIKLQAATLAGISISVVLVARYLLVGTPTHRILLVGFGLLLVYHLWMWGLFGPAQAPAAFWLPMFVQGLGTGTLMVPLALFTLSSLPASTGMAGSLIGTTTRFLAFITSMALVNFAQLYWRTAQLDRFRQDLLPGGAVLTGRLQGSQAALHSRGLATEAAARVATRLVANTLETQAMLRYTMNYYAAVSVAIAALLVVLVLMPPLHRQYAAFRQQPL